MRSKKALYNSIGELALQVITVACGMVLPWLIRVYFGSNYNGITSSITQFISYIALLTAGVGGVTRAALYKPLADNDVEKVSGIMRATEIFMRKVALIFAAGLLGFAAIYPFFVRNEFDWLFSFTLVLILGLGTFAQYYFGITYKLLLTADQRGYISGVIQIVTVILNTLVAAALIVLGFSIHIVRLGSALVYVINPLATYLYVHKRYKILRDVPPDNSALKQRWDAFAHYIASFIHDNTDIAILTVFSNLTEVAVYAVYALVIRNIQNLARNFSGGVEGAFGNMLAKGEKDQIAKNLRIFEFINFTIANIFTACTVLLILPFVALYTANANDTVPVNYIRPLFCYVFIAAEYIFTVRKPYQSLVMAAGHFRQTRNGAIFEAVLNVTLSMVLVWKYGLVGAAIGTLAAMTFRTLQYAIYMSRHIVYRSTWVFAKKLLVSIANILTIVLIVYFAPGIKADTYSTWILYALMTLAASALVTMVYTLIFYREEFSQFLRIMKGILGRKKASN